MKKNIKNSIAAVCIVASSLGIGIAASAGAYMPIGNGIWKYGDETVNGGKCKYSDYNNPDYVWYSASVGDKNGNRLVRVIQKNSTKNAHARYLKKLGGKTVFYNHGNGAVPK